LTAVSGRVADFQERDCDILGISTDSLETHERWLSLTPAQGGLGGLTFPLAADPEGAICRAYGVYLPRQHVALRGLFIIDPNGVVQFQVTHSLTVGRSVEEMLRVLDALQTGGVCAGDWQTGQAPLDPAQTLGPNRVVGQYRIDSVLGSGGFAVVFRATDLMLRRPVALKVIRQELARSAETVLTEARAAAALNHANIATLYSVDTSQGFPIIVMEYVEGEPLSKLLEHERVPLTRARALGKQIALGMAAAHAQLIVHGDLKPPNLMVTPTDQIKIMDFGLARKTRPVNLDETTELPRDGAGLTGTPAYMSPEQARGEVLTSASDVFSLGQVLFEMVTGRRAIHATNLLEALQGVQRVNGAALAQELPAPFDDIVRRALIVDPNLRTLRMADIADLLDGVHSSPSGS
jgi:eukaryotic-like serine/threonine-protein kinase